MKSAQQTTRGKIPTKEKRERTIPSEAGPVVERNSSESESMRESENEMAKNEKNEKENEKKNSTEEEHWIHTKNKNL